MLKDKKLEFNPFAATFPLPIKMLPLFPSRIKGRADG